MKNVDKTGRFKTISEIEPVNADLAHDNAINLLNSYKEYNVVLRSTVMALESKVESLESKVAQLSKMIYLANTN